MGNFGHLQKNVNYLGRVYQIFISLLAHLIAMAEKASLFFVYLIYKIIKILFYYLLNKFSREANRVADFLVSKALQ